MSTISPRFTVAGVTHPGKTRDMNEDAMSWDLDLGFVAVADGMGGHNAGEVASRLALDNVRAFLQRSASDDFTWPYGVNPRLSLTANRLTTAVKIANHRIFRASEERAEYTGMGTTLVAALVESGTVTFSSVGDSRLYMFQDSALRQLTRDDSWIAMVAEESGVDPSTLTGHPLRNVLTNVVGAQPDVKIALGELPLGMGILVFCTDGLHGALTAGTMTQILSDAPDLERAAHNLVQAALERDGKDNITVILARASGS
jgi:serine/threonine protein phosphatase PrpC